MQELDVSNETTNLYPFAHLSSAGIDLVRSNPCQFVSDAHAVPV
jgi:hypothetical protein